MPFFFFIYPHYSFFNQASKKSISYLLVTDIFSVVVSSGSQ